MKIYFQLFFFWHNFLTKTFLFGMMTSEVSITIHNYCFSHNISYLARQFVTPSLAAPHTARDSPDILYLFQPPRLARPGCIQLQINCFIRADQQDFIRGSDQLIVLFRYNNQIDNLLGLINPTTSKLDPYIYFDLLHQYLFSCTKVKQYLKNIDLGNLFHNKLSIHVMITVFREEN